jgi:hypothetical protein
MTKVPARLLKHADLQEAMEIDKRTCVDLGQYDRCAVTQRTVSILKYVGRYRPRRKRGLSKEL